MDGLLSSTERLVAVDSEPEYGVDPWDGATPAAWLNFEEFTWTPEVQIEEDETIRAVHSGYPDVRFGSKSGVSWRLPMTGKSGGAGTAPHWAALLKSANFAETVNAGVSVEYSMITGMNQADVPSAAFAAYLLEQDRINARKLLFLGTRGNRTLTFEMGKIARIAGQDVGKYLEWPAGTVPKPANPSSYAGDKPGLLVVGMEVLCGGDPYPLEAFTFETRWTVHEDREGTQAGSTLNHVFLTRPRSSRAGGSKTLKGRSLALSDILPRVKSGTPLTFAATLADGTDTINVELPAIQYGNYSTQSDGHIKFDLPYFANGTGAGENDIKITFT